MARTKHICSCAPEITIYTEMFKLLANGKVNYLTNMQNGNYTSEISGPDRINIRLVFKIKLRQIQLL